MADASLGTVGTATFLFTDIEGSTKLWEYYPRAMRHALARHDTLLRQAIERHDGAVFKTGGDAFYAIFASAADAARAAVGGQRALYAEKWPEMEPLRIRMALNTGPALPREGDYFGPTLNHAARLLAAAHGGQILLAEATAEIARGRLPEGASLRDLGQRRLKDLGGAHRIYQLIAPGLPANFPPLHTLDARPTNLPAQLTSFVGREQEVSTLSQWLRRPAARLVTLTGPGGTGKTRLSLQVAANLLDDFDHGVFFVALGLVNDPALVLSTIALTLGLKEAPDRPLLATLSDFLRPQQMLLVLDNFEQVLVAAEALVALLTAAPELKIVATSRAALDVYGEHEYPVPPLPVPALPLAARNHVGDYPAVALFVERARAVRPDFALTRAETPAVVEICARLDGLPLAIELAAAHSRLLTPSAMLSRMTSTLDLLSTGPRNRPERQKSLRGAISWSYDLLNEGEKVLLARLAVFGGGCTLAAAEAVGNAEGDLPFPVATGVASLVYYNLVRQQEAKEGEPRFTMMGTIREYALEQLALRPEAETVQRRHAAYFMALAETAETELNGPQQVTWLDRLEGEHDNLRAALDWFIQGYQPEMALRLSGALWLFWHTHGHLHEGRRWLEAALSHSKSLSPVARAKALQGAGVLAYLQNDYGRAVVLLEESLAIRSRLGDRAGIAYTLNYLGAVAELQGDYGRARAFYQESLELFRQIHDGIGIARALNNLGLIALEEGDYGTAAPLFEESLALANGLGEQWTMAIILHNMGRLALHEDEDRAAVKFYEQSLKLRRELGDRWGIAHLLSDLAHVELNRRKLDHATRLYRESLVLRQELGDQIGVAHCLEGLAVVAQARGQAAWTARLGGAADALRKMIGTPLAPVAQPPVEGAIAAAVTELGEAGFAAAWSEGQAMTMEQAVGYAQSES